MDLNQIKIFNTVCEKKSFSSAAEELYLTQPTVSFHIKNLEQNLGIELFKRKYKSENPITEAGEMLYKYTSSIMALLNEGKTAMTEYKKGMNGSLSLSVSPTALHWFLYDILKEFKNKYPAVNLTVHSAFSPKTIERVLNRDTQFGVIRYNYNSYTDALLTTECIASDTSVFICSPKHKLNKLNKVVLEDIKKETFIVYAKETNYWEQIKNVFQAHSFSPEIGIALNDINTIKKMVNLGMGISFVPKLSVEQEISENKLATLHVDNLPSIIRYSLLIYRKDHIFTGASQNFYNLLRKTYGTPMFD